MNNQRVEVNNNDSVDDDFKREELEKMKKELVKKSKEIINQFINQYFKDINEYIKFLLLVDEYNKNKKWNDKIMNIIIKNFNNDKIYSEKYTIIQLLNKKSRYNEAIKLLNSLIEEIIINIVKDIKDNFSRKEYNEKEGFTCLEHIIIKSSYGQLNENTSSEIVNQILSNNIFDKNYNFNIK